MTWTLGDSAKLCLKIYQELRKDGWGTIEPDLFYNAGNENFDPDSRDLMYNKCSRHEAADWSYGLLMAIHRAVLKARLKT